MIRFQIPIALFSLLWASVAHAQTPAPRFVYRNTVQLGDFAPIPLAEALDRFKLVAKRGAKSITLRIDSQGGEIELGGKWTRAMEEFKKNYRIRVTCIVDGFALSMAAVTLQSSLCDRRLATLRSIILFHNGIGGSKPAALEALNVQMALTVTDRIGMDLDAYRARIAEDSWVMAVREALAMNVIDGIADPRFIAPAVFQ